MTEEIFIYQCVIWLLSFVIGILFYSWLKHNSHRFRKCVKCKKWIGFFNPSYCGVVHLDGSRTTLHSKCLEGDNIRNYMKHD